MKPLAILVCGAVAAFLASVQDTKAQQCPTTFAATDTALWAQARESKSPIRWVRYFVTAQCQENKPAAQQLFAPFFGAGSSASAMSTLRLMGRFSGKSIPEEPKGNGQALVPTGTGADLQDFNMISIVKVTGIPANLYPSPPTDPSTNPSTNPKIKDVALWIRFRCHGFGGGWTGYFGDPGTSGGCHIDGNSFDHIEFQFLGPYAQFFDFHEQCGTTVGPGSCANYGAPIRSVTVTLSVKAPYSQSFMGMLTGGYAN